MLNPKKFRPARLLAAIAAVCISLSATSAFACVALVASTGTKRALDAAVGEVFSIETLPTIASCNERAAHTHLMYSEAVERGTIMESISIQCILPLDCRPSDSGSIELYSRVILLVE